MRKKLMILGILALMLFSISCKKDSVESKIIGTWRYSNSRGGMLPPQTINSEILLKLTKNDFEIKVDGKLTKQGNYRITDEKSWDGDRRIIFENNDSDQNKQFIKASGNQLIIFSGAPIAADGLESYYTRVGK